MKQIVVVGAGQAGASLVARLRGRGYGGELTLIGAEPEPPYQRPPLSKAYLLGEIGRDRLYLRPRAWYDEQGIALRLGAPVTKLDPAGRTLTVAGKALGFDAAVLATGSAPRRLPAAIGGDLAGVHTMRDLADADAIGPHLTQGGRARSSWAAAISGSRLRQSPPVGASR